MSRSFRLRVSSKLAEVFEQHVVAEGYGPRKKAVWVSEALEQLEQQDPKLIRVGVGDDLDVPRETLIGISLSREAFERLERLSLRVREVTPLMEGVRSVVIRTAIRHRIRHAAKRASSP